MSYLSSVKINDYISVDYDGNVYSRGKVLSQRIDGNSNYLRVKVYIDGKRKKYLVHRLIATAFIPNPDGYKCVNHKDGNKLNNSVDNLEWCSYSDNLIHAYKNNLRKLPTGTNNPYSKLTSEQVKEIRKSYIRGKHTEFNTYGLAKKYNVSPKCISNIVKGITYTDELFVEEMLENDRKCKKNI